MKYFSSVSTNNIDNMSSIKEGTRAQAYVSESHHTHSNLNERDWPSMNLLESRADSEH